jgi:hypothetical protein
MAYNMNTYMKGMIRSCAAPDDDPLAQCLGVYQEEAEEGGALYFGEMGEGQMHGLGRMDSASATYVGFWERGMYQGPGLLLDHDERSRQEGVFRDGVLAEGSSASPTVDRQGRRGADGRELEGEGVKVARDAQHDRLRVLRGTFEGDHPEGRGSMWILGAPKADGEAAAPGKGDDERRCVCLCVCVCVCVCVSVCVGVGLADGEGGEKGMGGGLAHNTNSHFPCLMHQHRPESAYTHTRPRSGMVLEQRFEGIFHRDPTYGRTYFQVRAYAFGVPLPAVKHSHAHTHYPTPPSPNLIPNHHHHHGHRHRHRNGTRRTAAPTSGASRGTRAERGWASP